ncbi:TonB family protein [Halioxenophilus sp. WMMB6]|uniref:TonB family protein n=1 Tax=Halioxenophilus sp. WMMB6 TaxID=3073815 RepID=UPI00295EB74E|nr:TonB family protein [Halioxenophilus sp. WMMB6]
MNRYLQLFVLLLASLGAVFVQAQSWVDGNFARYDQYKRPVFIAHLQSTTAKLEASDLLAGRSAFRLDLAIEAEYFSDRRFNRLWRESLGINVGAAQIADESDNIEKLSSFVSYDLYRGDHFTVEFLPGKGTSLQVNALPALSLQGSKLGVLMLQGLLGDVPLSSEFKQAMLTPTADSQALKGAYAALQPGAQRAQQIAEATAAQEATEEEVASAEPEPVAKPTPKPTPKAAPVTVASASPSAAAEKSRAPEAKAEPKPKPAPVQKPVVKVTPPQPPHQTKVAAATPEKKAPPVDLDDKNKKTSVQVAMLSEPQPSDSRLLAMSDAQLLNASSKKGDSKELVVAQQAYQTELERQIRKYQTIPFSAFTRRMEGDVTLDVTVDSSGRIKKLNIAKPSRHNLLNDQALDAASSAEPFTPIPSTLGVDQFSFTIVLSYDLVY